MVVEQESNGAPGAVMLPLLLLLLALALNETVDGVKAESVGSILAAIGFDLLVLLAFSGLFVVNPNEAKVLQLFGKYAGTARTAGLRWNNPLYTKRTVSQRTRNFETAKIKVNDKSGSPIEIAAVVVWRVADTAEALFNVDDYINFVRVQSESAIRNLASRYSYVADVEGEMALAGHTNELAGGLQEEIQERLKQAGVEVVESRISHFAYAPEIAAAMLQRQQASAVVAARFKIVEGAVAMVEEALAMLSARQVVDLDPERRAAMVSNLLVVLCSDRHVQPVINAGSLYT
jgi:hypothetical protein